MHIISPPSFCLSGLLNKPRLRSKKKFFDLGEALAYLTGHSGRRGGGLIICILGLKKCLTITTWRWQLLFYERMLQYCCCCEGGDCCCMNECYNIVVAVKVATAVVWTNATILLLLWRDLVLGGVGSRKINSRSRPRRENSVSVLDSTENFQI